MVRVASLFSGVGGGDLFLQHVLDWQPLCYVEWDKFCQEVLRARIGDGWLRAAPVFADINDFNLGDFGRRLRGVVDVVFGSPPCQGFSVAGKQLAADDPRNGWPAFLEVIREARPPVVLLENVQGLLGAKHGYFGVILRELAGEGYDAVWTVVGASHVEAPHRRNRLFLLAFTPEADGLLLRELERWSGGARGPEDEAEPGREGLAGGVARGQAQRSGAVAVADAAGQGRPPEPVHAAAPGRPEPGRGGVGPADDGLAYANDGQGALQPAEAGVELRDGPGDGGVGDPDCEGLAERPVVAGVDGGELSAAQRAGRVWWRFDPSCGVLEPLLGGMADGLAPGLDLAEVLGEWHAALNGEAIELPQVPRVTNSLRFRRARLTALGNGIVPQQFWAAWLQLLQMWSERPCTD